MGRTLHYSIKKEGKFNKKELMHIYNVCIFYNSDELLKEINTTYNSHLKELWTCENFWIGLGNCYPNWNNTDPAFKYADTAWKFIEQQENELSKTMDKYDVIKTLKKQKYIVDEVLGSSEIRAFTKVQGNEFNSFLVLQALIDISKKLPNVTIKIFDEGEFLFCPLTIKKGKAKPDINDLVKSIQYYAGLMIFSNDMKNYCGMLFAPQEFSKCFKQDLHLDNSSDIETYIHYINNKLRNLKEIETALISQGLRDADLYFYNIENSDQMFDPMLFTRKVNVEKFLSYECQIGTLMDGFDGEGFGLTDKDSESESYKTIAKLQKMLGSAFKNIMILGEKK